MITLESSNMMREALMSPPTPTQHTLSLSTLGIDRALNLAIAEMYLQGVSIRKVAKVMNEICGGNGVSATYVSQCCAQLDTLL